MHTREIVLPITEPETEWLLGRAVRKVSPTLRHSLLQREFLFRLNAWAAGRGQALAEWRFRMAPPGEVQRPLVPDVAFVWNERLRGLTWEEADLPGFAPDVAVEILSRDDRAVHVAEKVDVYLACGCAVVILVNPFGRTVATFEPGAFATFREGDALEHAALPGFRLAVSDLFSVLTLPA